MFTVNDLKLGYEAPPEPVDGEFSNTRVAIVATRWNTDIVGSLIEGARDALTAWGVPEGQIVEFRAPGAYEIPLACEHIARGKHFDGVVTLGAVIKGDTPHFDFVAGECASGLQQVMLKHAIPIGFGVLTVNTVEQAWERAGDGKTNKGYEAALAMLEMIRLEWALND